MYIFLRRKQKVEFSCEGEYNKDDMCEMVKRIEDQHGSCSVKGKLKRGKKQNARKEGQTDRKCWERKQMMARRPKQCIDTPTHIFPHFSLP